MVRKQEAIGEWVQCSWSHEAGSIADVLTIARLTFEADGLDTAGGLVTHINGDPVEWRTVLIDPSNPGYLIATGVKN
jgi:hypothetical protein